MKKIFFLSFLVFSIAACQPVKPDGEAGESGADSKGGASAGSISDKGTASGTALDKVVSYEKNAINDSNSVLFERVIYFDYDSSEIRGDFVQLIKHHGKYLALNKDVVIRLEGHTDERGSREYNIALADRRAQAVKRLLSFEGASNKQITIISYGEEKPADLGHNEEAWRLNRRAEFVYN